jgi:hypothetical protein
MTRFFIAVTRRLLAQRRFVIAGRTVLLAGRRFHFAERRCFEDVCRVGVAGSTGEASRRRSLEDVMLVLDDGRIFTLAGRLVLSVVTDLAGLSTVHAC